MWSIIEVRLLFAFAAICDDEGQFMTRAPSTTAGHGWRTVSSAGCGASDAGSVRNPQPRAPRALKEDFQSSRISASADYTPYINARAYQSFLQRDEVLCCCSYFFRGQSI